MAFFGACERYARAPECIGSYDGVYSWISQNILKGQRTTSEVRDFASKVYNARRKRARHGRSRLRGQNPVFSFPDDDEVAESLLSGTAAGDRENTSDEEKSDDAVGLEMERLLSDPGLNSVLDEVSLA